jgi:hypothetical protein
VAIGIQRPSFHLGKRSGHEGCEGPNAPGAVAQAKELAGTEPDSVLGNKAGDT